MAKYTNDSGGVVMLPDGRRINANDEFDLSSDEANWSGVKALIDGGMVNAKAKTSRSKSSDDKS